LQFVDSNGVASIQRDNTGQAHQIWSTSPLTGLQTDLFLSQSILPWELSGYILARMAPSLTHQPVPMLSEPKKKILCVEDHHDMWELITIDLPEYEVIGAYSKADALNKAREDQFDLYLLDYHLPDGTGIELCLLIRAFDPDTPIFLCTGTTLTVEQIENAGGQRFIFKNETFLWKVREAVTEVLSPQ